MTSPDSVDAILANQLYHQCAKKGQLRDMPLNLPSNQRIIDALLTTRQYDLERIAGLFEPPTTIVIPKSYNYKKMLGW